MKVKAYLIVNNKGSFRVTKNLVPLKSSEIGIWTTLNIPDAIFKKPSLQAEITILESLVPKSPINADVVDNVKDAIKSVTGLEFSITVTKQEEEEANFDKENQ